MIICISVMQNLTLEPVLFFMSFVGSMDSASIGQLVIDKSCNIDFNFTQEICDNLLDDMYTEENELVEAEVSQFKVDQFLID